MQTRQPWSGCARTIRSCFVMSMPKGGLRPSANPNGSLDNIAGVCNEARNVFGLMPHPEDACNKLLGSEDGRKIFSSIAAACAQREHRHA